MPPGTVRRMGEDGPTAIYLAPRRERSSLSCVCANEERGEREAKPLAPARPCEGRERERERTLSSVAWACIPEKKESKREWAGVCPSRRRGSEGKGVWPTIIAQQGERGEPTYGLVLCRTRDRSRERRWGALLACLPTAKERE